MNGAAETLSALPGPALTLILTALLVGAVLYAAWKASRMAAPPSSSSQPTDRSPGADLANMMILFQTLRDVLQQQKDLAREFNASLDRKVAVIRQAAETALQNLEALRETRRKLGEELEEMRAELAALRAEAAAIRGRKPDGPPAPSPPASEDPVPPLRVVAAPPEEPDPSDLIDNWVGFDFGTEPLEDEEESLAEELPIEPDDPVGDREAFRALLDLGGGSTTAPPPEPAGNGKALSPSIQARVLSYHKAGMNVSQIAQELGIGKGEVRLILNLRSGDR